MKKRVFKCLAIFMVSVVLLTTVPLNNILVESLKMSSIAFFSNVGNIFENINIALPTLSLDAFAAHGSITDKWGWSANWEVSGKTLTISGKGKFSGFSSSKRPAWEQYKDQIEVVVVKSGAEVPAWACVEYPNLKTVNIYSGEKIGANAFSGCKALESVYIASSKEIGNYAFLNCESLVNVSLPGNLEKIYSAFSGCTSLEKIELPENVEYLSGTFNNCKNLKEIEIPDSVTYIGSRTFSNCSSLESFDFPANLQKLGGYAFSGMTCFVGKEIVLPSTLTEVNLGALAGCQFEKLTTPIVGSGSKSEENNLFFGYMFGTENFENSNVVSFSKTKYYIPNSLKEVTLTKEVGAQGFINIDGIEKVTFAETVETNVVPKYCFQNCNSLKEVVFLNDDKITQINAAAFKGCIELESVVIPDGIKIIGENAFMNCEKLAEVSFPETDFSVYKNAFAGTEFLSEYKGDYLIVGDGVLINCKSSGEKIILPQNVKRLCNSFTSPENIKSVVFNEGLKAISTDSFNGCKNISELVIPESVEKIDNSAFKGMCGLKKLTVPFVTSKISGWFGNTKCSVCNGSSCKFNSNGGVYLPKNFDEIFIMGGVINSGCLSYMHIKTVTLGDNVTEIKENALSSSGIETLNFSSGFSVSELPDGAFCNNNLTSITIPQGVKIIKRAFVGNPLTKIALNDGLEVIDGSFEDTEITKISLPDSLKEIGACSFSDCKNLESIILPDSLEKIGEYSFSGCESLERVTIGKSLKEISEGAFSRTAVKKYVLSEENPHYFSEYGIIYTNKGEFVLYPYGSEEPIYRVSDKVTLLSTELLGSLSCLEAIVVDENNPKYTSIDGVLYNKDVTSLIRYPKAKVAGEYVAPATLREVEEYAFSGVKNLDSVVFKNNINFKFGCFASAEFQKLTATNLDKQLDYYFHCEEDDIFNGNETRTNLKELVLTNQRSDLSDGFASRYRLQSVELKGTLTQIGELAFKMADIKTLTLPDSVTEIAAGAFNQCIKLENVKLSNSLKTIGDEAFYACPIKNIEFPQNLTSIGAWAFAFTELQYVELPDKVTFIGRCAFSGSNVKKTVISENLVDISTEAFQNCRDLEVVVLGSKVKNIEAQAFQNCNSLDMIVIPSSVTSIDDTAFINTSDNLVIYCNENSYAVKYASQKNIKYTTLVLSKIPNQTYKGEAIEPEVRASVNGKELALNSQYTLTYSDNINVGTAKVMARGLGDFKNLVANAQFKILARQLTDVTFSYLDFTYYEPSGAEPKLNVYINNNKLEKGKDYELVDWDDVKSVGTYNVTVKGINNLSGTYNFTVDILPRSITVTNVTKTGDIKVTDSGYTLVESVDYNIETRVLEDGTKKTYVVGIGNYTDEKECKESNFGSFSIIEVIMNMLKNLLSAIFSIFK